MGRRTSPFFGVDPTERQKLPNQLEKVVQIQPVDTTDDACVVAACQTIHFFESNTIDFVVHLNVQKMYLKLCFQT